MSESDLRCRKCKGTLGVRHHGGRLHVSAGVAVILDADARNGPLLRLTCSCGEARDWMI